MKLAKKIVIEPIITYLIRAIDKKDRVEKILDSTIQKDLKSALLKSLDIVKRNEIKQIIIKSGDQIEIDVKELEHRITKIKEIDENELENRIKKIVLENTKQIVSKIHGKE